MAFRRTLAQKLTGISKMTSPTLTNCRMSSPSAFKTLAPDKPAGAVAPDPRDDGFFRRFLQRRSIFQPAAWRTEIRSLAISEGLLEKLRTMDIARNRLRLDGLAPPPPLPPEEEEEKRSESGGITVADARKLLRLSQLEKVKARLRADPRGWISYEEYAQICIDSCSSRDQGLGFAKMLDESGTVIVLGSLVCLRPQQVVQAIEGLIGAPSAGAAPNFNDPRMKELEAMEKEKAAINRKAESLVRRELWCGLGFFMVQTLGFMRLTFWELSWDVMEPICFYVTSAYAAAGYAFFMRTAKEPTFEGFFQGRLMAKRKRLMQVHNFDIEKYEKLRQDLSPATGDAAPAAGVPAKELASLQFHS